jgi:hypothetical protein
MKITRPSPLAVLVYLAAALILGLLILGFEPGRISDDF